MAWKRRRKTKKTDREKLEAICDSLWSRIVVERDNYTCQSCRRYGDNPHHVFSRKHRGTRWDTDNGICLCWACHANKAHGTLEVFRDWIISRWGREKFDRIKMRAMAVSKVDPTIAHLALMAEVKCRGIRLEEKKHPEEIPSLFSPSAVSR